MKRILEVSSWDGFYDSLGLKPLTPQQQVRQRAGSGGAGTAAGSMHALLS